MPVRMSPQGTAPRRGQATPTARQGVGEACESLHAATTTRHRRRAPPPTARPRHPRRAPSSSSSAAPSPRRSAPPQTVRPRNPSCATFLHSQRRVRPPQAVRPDSPCHGGETCSVADWRAPPLSHHRRSCLVERPGRPTVGPSVGEACESLHAATTTRHRSPAPPPTARPRNPRRAPPPPSASSSVASAYPCLRPRRRCARGTRAARRAFSRIDVFGLRKRCVPSPLATGARPRAQPTSARPRCLIISAPAWSNALGARRREARATRLDHRRNATGARPGAWPTAERPRCLTMPAPAWSTALGAR